MDICCELEKLPAIFHHFEHHREDDGDSFFEFVYEDLLSSKGTEDGHHNDSNHEDLPFSGSHQCSHAPVAFVSFQLENFAIEPVIIDMSYGMYLSQSPQGYIDSPFQPPKG
jgi:hypothetical protein